MSRLRARCRSCVMESSRGHPPPSSCPCPGAGAARRTPAEGAGLVRARAAGPRRAGHRQVHGGRRAGRRRRAPAASAGRLVPRADLEPQRRGDAPPAGHRTTRRHVHGVLGAHPLLSHRVHDELDRQGRLARARTAQHAQHARTRVDGGPLALVEPHLRRGEGRGSTEDDHRRIPSRPTDSARDRWRMPRGPSRTCATPARPGSQAEHHRRARDVTGDQRSQRHGEVTG